MNESSAYKQERVSNMTIPPEMKEQKELAIKTKQNKKSS